MIATGGFYNGPELKDSRIDRMLRATGKTLGDARGDWKEGDTPGLVVLFVVPGSLGDVNFVGQRVTLFSRKKKLVQIEAAVPTEVVEAGGSVDFVIDALHRANAIAAEVFAKKGTEPFDLAKAEAIVEKVKDALLAQQD